MSTLEIEIETARAFLPLLDNYRYKGVYGGRGSGKSHFFAEGGVERSLMLSGHRWVCVREVQRTLKDSVKLLIEDKIRKLGVIDRFRIKRDEIETPGGGLILFQGMQDHTAESIKSLEGFDLAWIEEAQTLSERSLEMLRPTIRKPGSEIWASWNPRNENDPIDKFFRGLNPPPDSVAVKANYEDNPFFPEVLEQERLWDLENKRERYGHIWLGEYEPMAIGAIWNRANLHAHRRSEEELPELERVVVAIDPAVGSEEDGGDQHGIIAVAKGTDDRGYVLADGTLRGTPRRWAERALALYDRCDADSIVAEVNQGGDMVEHVITSVRANVNVIKVRATRGKHVRAEPISALYEQGKISHVGTFPELEDQMCLMTAAGYDGDDSPDRVDALVWGFTELFPSLTVGGKLNLPKPKSPTTWMGA